jgi:hypothetical protein
VANVRRIAVILGCAATAAIAAAVAACGSSHGHSQTQSNVQADTATWSDLTRVSVDVDQPGIPGPPGTTNTPTTFTKPAQLTTVTTALNADHIRKAQHTTTSDGCAGGVQIEIEITQRHHGRTDLSAYHCGNTTTGDIAGNLTGFLNGIGVGTT